MSTIGNIWRGAAALQSVQDLAGRVRDRVIAEAASDLSNIIEAGDFRIDMGSRAATVRGRLLQLSCTEFDVLVFIVSHRKRVVTSNTTLATQPEEGGVRQAHFLPALLSLKKKLQDAAPGAQYIRADVWILYEFHPGT